MLKLRINKFFLFIQGCLEELGNIFGFEFPPLPVRVLLVKFTRLIFGDLPLDSFGLWILAYVLHHQLGHLDFWSQILIVAAPW